MGAVDFENVDLAYQELAVPPVVHVVEQLQGALAEARRGVIARHRLKARAEPARVAEVSGVAGLVGIPRRPLRARVSLPSQAALPSNHLQHLVGVTNAIDSVLLKRLIR